jgi:ATP-binding cassette, subfamily G (WHITE), member 2, SNQ2
LQVKGAGLGVTTNQTFGGLFLAPIAKISRLFSHGVTPQRTLLHGFSGSVKDGEMLLVLGRPGSGCSTFLKTIASQTEGYTSVEGEVSYGGLTPQQVKKNYRDQVIYNQGHSLSIRGLMIENDVHYATLTVKQTLAFALKTRTPNQLPENMTRRQYRSTFLNILFTIFGIKHTINTPVGNEVLLHDILITILDHPRYLWRGEEARLDSRNTGNSWSHRLLGQLYPRP